MYNILEVTFDPLTLCSTIAPLFQSLSTDTSYAPYLPLLQHALLSRLLSQLSQVYSSIKIDNLLELVAPLRASTTEGTSVFDEEQIEAYVMGCARRGELNIRVDHAAGSITFVDGTFSVVEDPSSSTMASASPIQPSTSETVRTRLSELATCLHNSITTLFPPTPLPEEEQQAKFASLVAAAHSERKALQLRRSIVARRRELAIELAARKDKEQASRRAELSRKEKEEEERRRAEEARKREVERAKREIEAIRNEEARKLAQSLKEKGTLKVDVNVSVCPLRDEYNADHSLHIQEMENLSTDNLMRLQVEQLEKEKKEINEKMRIVAKRLDHLERAYRKEERPLLAKDYEQQQANDKAAHEAAQKARIETARLQHQHDLETKKRLLRVMDDYKAYRETVIGKRSEEFTRRQQLAQKKIEEEKAKRRAAILKEREEERLRLEEEERIRREREEEERRLEEGTCCFRPMKCAKLTILSSQNVSPRRSVSAQSRKLPPPRPRPRSAKKRRRLQLSASNASSSARRPWRPPACASSARTRRRSVASSVPPSASASVWEAGHPQQQLLPPARTSGGAPARPPLRVRLRLCRPPPPRALRPSSGPALLPQVEAGVLVWLPRRLRVLVLPPLVRSPVLSLPRPRQRPQRRLKRRKTASRLSRPRGSGGRGAVAGPKMLVSCMPSILV